MQTRSPRLSLSDITSSPNPEPCTEPWHTPIPSLSVYMIHVTISDEVGLVICSGLPIVSIVLLPASNFYAESVVTS
jgi:hypothetical protein